MKKQINRLVAGALIAMLAAGCATQPGQPNQQYAGNAPANSANANDDPCSVGGSALAGAAVGALLGALVDGKRGAVRGAALGGVTGAAGCVAINARSRQTKSAAQADQEYLRARGRMPREPEVVAYTPVLNSAVVKRGQPFVVSSTVELVNGSTRRVEEVREEIVVLDPSGAPFKQGSKAVASTNRSSGRFENSFELTLPQGVSQGMYGLKTNLYVNGRLAASRDLRTQLVWNGVEGRLVAMR
ncbi:hypothetical protein QPK31_03910 [Massilia sp. YIM B02769]|uniref:hypothetical protein n=1 Tax=Massilia sp. YIM B02769 TaxID=3050129 RepID=UPI0025B6A57A|nr:hypothetical protein [Massilia sp. YIM B02769]MDN4057368.1 hypothetical protein [Massilia sp. YIM B02769]